MEIPEDTRVAAVAADAPWGDPPPPKIEEQDLDLIAFELWQRGSRQDPVAEQDCSDEEEVVAGHASCL